MVKDEYYKFGYEKFGSFLLGYTMWLREVVKKENCNKIFFFSRDGYMMEKAYDVLEESHSLGIEKEYVFFSRNSIRQALLWKCDTYEESLQYLSVAKYISTSELLSYYGYSAEEAMQVAQENGLDYYEDLEFTKLAENQKVIAFYENQKADVINKRSKEKYDLLYEYLHQIKMLGKCVIVDIGWKGSMQYYLEKFFEISEMDTQISGIYVGVDSSSLTLKGKTFGYLYSNEDLSLRKKVLCFFGGIEKLFQSLEGSTKGYCKVDGKVVATKEPYEYEGQTELMNYITSWQEGALDYVKDHANDKEEKSFIEYAKPVLKVGMSPTLKDVELFRFFYNTDGEKSYYLPQKKLFEYSLKEFMHALSNSVWKTGFMKAAFKIPFPYFQIYNLLRK